MTVSPFSNSAVTSEPTAALAAPYCELVRGNESLWIEQLTPRIQRQPVTLDLSTVERIDAAGIATLISLYCTSVEAGTEFSVVSPSAHVHEMLRIVGLESILIAECRNLPLGRNCLDRSAA